MKKEKDFFCQIGDRTIGKFRDFYEIVESDILICHARNEMSIPGQISSKVEIPFRGVFLNLTTAGFMEETEDIIPNCLMGIPHPAVSIQKRVFSFNVEIIVKAKNTRDGKFKPEATPIMKIKSGYTNVSTKEILTLESLGEMLGLKLMTKEELNYITEKALQVFERSNQIAQRGGLILTESQYKFGKGVLGKIYLMGEVNTLDSSQYFYQKEGGKSCQVLGELFHQTKFSPKMIDSISQSYRDLYKALGFPMDRIPEEDNQDDLTGRVNKSLAQLL